MTASLNTGNDLPYAWFKADFEFQEKYFRDGNQYPIGVYHVYCRLLCGRCTTQQFYAEYAQQPYVVTESVTGNWYDAHALWAVSDPPTTSEEYKLSVATWLQTDEGKGYQEDVLLDAQNNIIATKTDVRWKFNKRSSTRP